MEENKDKLNVEGSLQDKQIGGTLQDEGQASKNTSESVFGQEKAKQIDADASGGQQSDPAYRSGS